MARGGKGEFDDRIEQDLRRGDRSRSEREPTRTCSQCSGRGNTTELRETGRNAKGKPEYRNVTTNCRSCGGRGVR